MIILQPSRTIPQLQDLLPQLPGQYYTMPTHPDSSDFVNHKKAWPQFGQLLREAYASKIRISGQYLTFLPLSEALKDNSPEMRYFVSKMFEKVSSPKLDSEEIPTWMKENMVPYRCAGTFARRLIKDGFDVSFTEAVFQI